MYLKDDSDRFYIQGRQIDEGSTVLTYRNGKSESMLWVLFIERAIKRIPLILAVMIGFGLAAGAAAKFVVAPTYRADAELIVNAGERTTQTITSDQLNSAETLVEIYGIIIKSNPILDQVLTDLHLDLDYDQLAEKVTVGAVNGTAVMRISVSDHDPELAMQILTKIISSAPDIIQDKVEAGSVKVISEPRLVSKPVSPVVSRYVVFGMMIGLLLMMSAILMEIVRNNTVNQKEQMEEQFNIGVLAEIPAVNREKGRSALLSDNSDFL